MEKNPTIEFEQRKGDHIRLALDEHSQTPHLSGLQKIQLRHEALPEINFSDVQIQTEVFGCQVGSPLFVSSMTAGHAHSEKLNFLFAKVCAEKSWAMGVGSQRRELFDANAQKEWREIRAQFPKLVLFGNIGLSQLIQTPPALIEKLVQSLGAQAMIVHTNPLQEAFQPEGTPEFKGGLKALKELLQFISVPVIVKETGCGFSQSTLQKLNDIGVAVVDLSGTGGTHWGRIEGERSATGEKLNIAASVFKDWGISTVDSLINARAIGPKFQIWASGGVRSGLDAAKFLAMGASMVGLAKPILKAALESEEALRQTMEQFEFELKVAMFCCGVENLQELQKRNLWAQV
jgi:isopentenyl-diphosphate delta-isomerase